MAFAADLGVSETAVVAAYPASTVSSVVFRLLGGWMIDTYPPRLILVAALVLQSAALGLAAFLLERAPVSSVPLHDGLT